MKHNMEKDWRGLLANMRHENLYHLILLPFYKEEREVLETTMDAMAESDYDTNKFLVVIAAEERAGEEFHQIL